MKVATQHGNLLWRKGPGRKFFERAEVDAVGLAELAVDSAGFGHAHLSVVEDQGRNIAGMGVAVADEATAPGRLIDRRLEDPEILLGATQFNSGLNVDAKTMLSQGQPQQCRMIDKVRIGR